ncbi:alkaline phosphatase [Geosmithia morbida]|uniref:Alkaline phosphatase n=1 Tax=Geosmithia morbida TaxID=1094350 RepID=A0A9P5D2Q0_9HYPO|nr:alkaline phosphatase [Geosmithia morbida]KAF4119719.1 alkaline phosphatase [Geosmithia morbida]
MQNPRPHAITKRSSRTREILLFTWATLATAVVIVLAVWMQKPTTTTTPPPPTTKRNLVFMVSDGMGPASLSLTRSYRQHVESLPIHDTLTLDRHFWGTSRTRSTSSLVTDSAAGATAFSCARKSYNGAISVTPDREPCGTVLEAAKRAGYVTGLAVTTDVTDATPACFASHVLLRSMEDDIALQEVGEGVLGRTVDLLVGGGRCHFLPNSTAGSCRADDVDVAALAARDHGWTYADSRAGFDAFARPDSDVRLPYLGLFAPRDIPFELDRRAMPDVYPSLSEMTAASLRALDRATADSDTGFFLMVEGSRIDHAGHINDPAAQVHEVLEYDAAFRAVLDFIRHSDTETVLVATSDHETGGLATAIQEPGHLPVYGWYPEALARASSSCEFLAAKLARHVASRKEDGEDGQGSSTATGHLRSWIEKNILRDGLGVDDATDEELQLLVRQADSAVTVLSAIISLRAHVGWSTHGHTAVDVNIYSSGNVDAVSDIRGNVENTDVGRFLRDYLAVDVEPITKELKEKMDLAGAESMLDHQAEHFHESRLLTSV